MAAAWAGWSPRPQRRPAGPPGFSRASLSLWFFPRGIDSSGAWERTLRCLLLPRGRRSRSRASTGPAHRPSRSKRHPGARSPLSAKSRTDQGTSWKKSCCWLLKAQFFVTALTQVFRLETPSAPLCPAGRLVVFSLFRYTFSTLAR